MGRGARRCTNKDQGIGKERWRKRTAYPFSETKQNDGDFEQLSWDDLFNNFDEKNLDLVYQDEKAAGKTSTFHKFVERGYEDGK